MARKLSNKYIARHEGGYTKGWIARPPKNFKENPKILHTRLFSDKLCGGSRKAKKAAIEYRNEYLKKTNQEYLLKNKTCTHTKIKTYDSKNTSGITGVRLAVSHKDTGANVNSYHSWEAYGNINGKSWRRSFSITLHGEKEAFKQACLARYEKHKVLYVQGNIKRLGLPCKIPVEYEKIIQK